MSWLKKLFCKHKYITMTNVVGSDVRLLGGCRSISKCTKCNKIRYNKETDFNCGNINYYLWRKV